MTPINDALDQFRRGPAILDEALRDLPASQLDRALAPGKWTIRQIVRHLADTEIVAGMRLRHILAEEGPTMVPFNQDAWATELNYAESDLQVARDTFAALRRDTAAVLDAASPEAFARIGIHPERGNKSLGEWVAIFARHVETHAGQIRAIREADNG